MPTDHAQLQTLIAEKYNDSKSQHLYFLLGTAGAGIAFVIQKTSGAAFSLTLLPALLALGCWFVSFLAGMDVVRRMTHILGHDHFLAGQRTNAALSGDAETNEFKDHVARQIDAMEAKRKVAGKIQRAQIALLAAGVVCFGLWYATGIFLASSACVQAGI